MSTQSYLINTFTQETRDKLHFADYFIVNEACNWTVISYLTQLVQKDPTMNARLGNRYLQDDVKLMSSYVISGTVAQTTLKQMASSSRTNKGKNAINKFWETSNTIASNTIEYAAQRGRMQAELAGDAVDELQSARRKRQRITQGSNEASTGNDDDDDNNEDDDDDDDDEKLQIEENNDIWSAWKRLLNNIKGSIPLKPLSPEYNDIIWYGKDVLRRPLLPEDLYNQLANEVNTVVLQSISPEFRPLISTAIDSTSLNNFNDSLDAIINYKTTLRSEKDIIVKMLSLFNDLFEGGNLTLSSSEGCLRSYVVDPLLKACNKYLILKGHDVVFFPGEIELTAMTTQLRAQGMTDGRLKYNADGKIVVKPNATEILISEVSSAFAENEKAKTSFDHYKAMFGLLAVLRTIASQYKYASFDTFSRLRIHFIHTHNRAIRHWTMFTPAPGLYIMNKEQKADIISTFEEKQDRAVPFITFSITLGVSLTETMVILAELEQEHKSVLENIRFDPTSSPKSLLQHIQPKIIRLNEGKHATEVADDGPQSPLYNPDA